MCVCLFVVSVLYGACTVCVRLDWTEAAQLHIAVTGSVVAGVWICTVRFVGGGSSQWHQSRMQHGKACLACCLLLILEKSSGNTKAPHDAAAAA